MKTKPRLLRLLNDAVILQLFLGILGLVLGILGMLLSEPDLCNEYVEQFSVECVRFAEQVPAWALWSQILIGAGFLACGISMMRKKIWGIRLSQYYFSILLMCYGIGLPFVILVTIFDNGEWVSQIGVVLAMFVVSIVLTGAIAFIWYRRLRELLRNLR